MLFPRPTLQQVLRGDSLSHEEADAPPHHLPYVQPNLVADHLSNLVSYNLSYD